MYMWPKQSPDTCISYERMQNAPFETHALAAIECHYKLTSLLGSTTRLQQRRGTS